MARSNVPKFGNWDSEESVPYTVYFDKARKNRGAGGKLINPNDPEENPELFASMNPPPPPAPAARPSKPRGRPEEPYGRGGVRPPVMEHKESREELGELRQFSDSPARSDGSRGQRPGRYARPSVGSEQSFDRSPLHPSAKAMGRGGSGSPHWEARNNNFDSSHGTPGRSRLGAPPPRPDETGDRGAAVPRFGEWNENDPQSAENFTHIFEKVREERKTVPGNAQGTPKHPSYPRQPPPSASPKACCFGWW